MLQQADHRSYLTIEEAAKSLRIKPTAVRNYLYEGKMTTYKFKTLTLLSESEVRSWKARQRGRQTGKKQAKRSKTVG
jgi:excisionase family DNA binding protein